MKYGYGVTEKTLRDLVEAVVRARVFDSATLLAALERGPISTEAREAIREALADELVETGLGPDAEPNDRGRLIETAIDWLGYR